MSTELVGKEIARFLATAEPEVLCLKGAWGVGKTYFWNRLLLDAKEQKQIALARYGYVSLFGIQTLDQLRAGIVTSTDPIEYIGEVARPGDDIVDRKLPRASTRTKLLSYLGVVPIIGSDLAKVAETLAFLAVREQLVCLDDLERKSDALPLKDVLGLATNLRDQQKCKVVLILNDGAFAGQDEKDFEKFFEKAIDSHVSFEPTPAECVAIALGDEKPNDLVAKYAIQLGISNIRVLMKLRRLAQLLAAACGNCSDAILEEAVKSLALATYSKHHEGAPNLHFLQQWTRFKRNDEQMPPEHKSWQRTLENYGFVRFSDLDLIISEAVASGFFDQDRLRSEVQGLDQQEGRAALEMQFERAWRRYHDSFDDDAEELAEQLIQSFKANVAQISPMNANGTIHVLKEIGKLEEARSLIDFYTQNRGDGVFSRSNLFSDNDLSDPDFAAAFDARAAAIVDNREPRDVLLQITVSQDWNPRDTKLLSDVNAEGYVAIFKSLRGADNLSQVVKTALMLARRDTTEANRMRGAVVEALRQISLESPLNAARVAKFGVPELTPQPFQP